MAIEAIAGFANSAVITVAALYIVSQGMIRSGVVGSIAQQVIAVSTAEALNVSARPMIIAVCFGASACFATPIGYKTNLMVYGPGRYGFGDYLKMGIPLNVLVILSGSLFIPWIWPF